jgi:hypothetical protein
MTAVISEVATGHSLVPVSLFDKLVSRVAKEERVGETYAGRVVDQALAFLGTCAVADVPLSPSDAVDPGWHAFVLHTREYAAFCELIAGRFIHHLPTDEDNPTTHGMAARSAIARTVEEIRRVGFVVDDELWESAPGKCSQCHSGCTDSLRLA